MYYAIASGNSTTPTTWKSPTQLAPTRRVLSSYAYLTSYNTTITVFANTTGGNGTGGNTGCGYNASSFYISGWYSPMPAYAGDTVNATVFTDCNLLNQTMTVHYAISNSSVPRQRELELDRHEPQRHPPRGSHQHPSGHLHMTADVYYGSSYAYLTSYNTTITVFANTTGGNGTGGNTGCGYESAYASINAYSLTSSYSLGDTFTGTIHTYCAVLNHTMVLDWTVRNTGTNNTVDAGSFNWTAMQLYETHNVTSAALATQPVGNYIFEAQLSWYNGSQGMWETLHSIGHHFTVSNSTGGNGTGGNTGCGYNASSFYISGWYSPMPAYAGDTVNATVFTDCNLLNQTMVVDYAISNSSTYLTIGNWTWTAMSLNDTHHVEVINVPAGTYTLSANVYYGSSYAYLTSYNTTITVFANTTGGNGTGNNTGGNGTGNTSGSNEYMDIDHSGYAYETADGLEVWTSGTDVEVAFESGNLSIGQNYSMVWWLWDNSGTNQITNGNASWIAYANVSIENHTISGLQDRTYHFEAALYNATGHSVGADFTTIQMGNNSGGNGTGNNTGGNGTGNNTGGNGTGNTSTSNEYMDIDHSGYAYETEEGLEVWASGTDVDVSFESGNLTIGQNYSMSWWLWDNSGTNMIAEGNASWTAYANVSIENQSFSLMDGTYHIEAALYNATGHTVGADFTTIQVGNNTGGNGTGNNTNNTGCGTAWNMTYHTTQLSQSVYNLGDEVNWETGVDCIVQGTNYTMEYYLSLDSAGSVEDFGSESWTGNAIFLAFDEEYTLSTAASMAGSYTIVTNLYASDNSTLLHSESVGFTVMGNNNSGNNTGNNTGNNQTTLGYSLNTNAWNDCINGVLVVNMTFQDTGNLTGGQMTVYIDIWQGSNSNISGTNVTSFSNTVTFDPNSGMASMDWAVDLNAAGLANGDYVLYLSSAFTDMYSTTFTLGCTGCGYDPSFHSNSTTFWWEGGSIRRT